MAVQIDGNWIGLTKAEIYSQLKNNPCVDCGNRFPPECMDFDHRVGVEKNFDVSKGVKKRLPDFLEEVAKCDLVCSNCHRVRTKARRQVDPNVFESKLLPWDHYEMTRGEQDDVIRFHSRVSQVDMVATTTLPNEHSTDKS